MKEIIATKTLMVQRISPMQELEDIRSYKLLIRTSENQRLKSMVQSVLKHENLGEFAKRALEDKIANDIIKNTR